MLVSIEQRATSNKRENLWLRNNFNSTQHSEFQININLDLDSRATAAPVQAGDCVKVDHVVGWFEQQTETLSLVSWFHITASPRDARQWLKQNNRATISWSRGPVDSMMGDDLGHWTLQRICWLSLHNIRPMCPTRVQYDWFRNFKIIEGKLKLIILCTEPQGSEPAHHIQISITKYSSSTSSQLFRVFTCTRRNHPFPIWFLDTTVARADLPPAWEVPAWSDRSQP